MNDIVDHNGALHSGDSGRFTGHLQSEGDADNILPAPTSEATLVLELQRAVGSTEPECRQALAECDNDPAKARTWLSRQTDINWSRRVIGQELEKITHARQRLAQHSVRGAVQRILQRFPEATGVRLANDSTNHGYFAYQRPDGSWRIVTDATIGGGLRGFIAGIDLTNPADIASCCIGYDPGSEDLPSGMQGSRSRLASADIDLTLFRP